MTGKALVLGAGGNFGGAVAKALTAAGWQVTRFQRGTDMTAAAQGMDVIVNGLNPPNYHNWARLIPQITDEAISAAQVSGATVLVPANVYPYGIEPGPWGAQTPHRPNTRKGVIRAQMEASYLAAASRGDVRVIILRGGDFLQSDAPNSVMHRVVLPGVKKGYITAFGLPDARRAYAYLPDLARATVGLLNQRATLPAFADVPFAGHVFSMNDLATLIARQIDKPVQIKPFAWWLFRVLGPFWELARELEEMRYLFDHSHSLASGPLAELLPDFKATPLDQIVADHLRYRGLLGK